MFSIKNSLKDRVAIGTLFASGVKAHAPHPFLEKNLQSLLISRKNPLTAEEDAFRKACRQMLRTEKYKPTGRGKPASEYLLRVAAEGAFPRINTLADINNFISLKFLVPVSLWDVDKAETELFFFRHGHPGESFVFNESGQTIQLEGLVAGFGQKGEDDIPMVTPVKDCHKTKATLQTRTLAAAVYYPAEWQETPPLEHIIEEFCLLMEPIASHVQSAVF